MHHGGPERRDEERVGLGQLICRGDMTHPAILSTYRSIGEKVGIAASPLRTGGKQCPAEKRLGVARLLLGAVP